MPKAIHQVPNLEHYHVIVALSPEAKKAFPQRPRKLVYLDWSVPDPSATLGDAEQIQKAHEATFEFIKNQIRDLMQAILDN